MTKIEERNDVLYSAIVPDRGNAGTIEGEMLRAINRIVYRDFYNDGDKYNEGYGAETAGSPMTFLMTSEEVPVEIRKFANKIDANITTSNYNQSLEKLLTVIIDYIESKDGNYTKSNVDMFDTKSLWENDDYYEDEYEEGCWQDDYYDEDEEFEWEKPIIYQLPDTEGNLTEVKVGQKIYDNTLFKPLHITCLCLWNNIIGFRDDKGAIGVFSANINNTMRVPRYTTNRLKRDFRPYFDFNQAPNGYDYGVISRSGYARWCTKKPFALENLNLWVSNDSVISAGYRQNLINPETGLVDDWQDSLVERPKDVK